MTKGTCLTCNAPAPEGMHCRLCLCDIFDGVEIGTTKEQIKKERNAKRRKKLKQP